jgi:hypothetical protein
MHVLFTERSRNAKTGAIAVTTSPSKTCPTACPFREGGCYAQSGPLKIHWDKLDKGESGVSWAEFCGKVSELGANRLWRHNQAGDLPGDGELIELAKLEMLVNANRGRRGFTYTHYDPTLGGNAQAIASANAGGFTINLSANNPEHADELKKLGIGPVVTILPREYPDAGGRTPNGHKIVVCPATTSQNTTCAECQLCANTKRSSVIGFKAHGSRAKLTETIAAKA